VNIDNNGNRHTKNRIMTPFFEVITFCRLTVTEGNNKNNYENL
jgi:hypothetical protein